MALISRSATTVANKDLRQDDATSAGNRKWLAEVGDADGVILIGGASLADFRIRVAQSSLRGDMLPSFWSQCGILLGDGLFVTVPLDLDARSKDSPDKRDDDVSAIPRVNAVRYCSLDEIDNPQRFPNLAVIRFAKKHDDVGLHIERLSHNRGIVDIPALMLPWLGFIWGVSGFGNPLMNGVGLPSSAFVETVFAMASFELTPGLSSASSCPEAIWQSAKWWTGFYESAAKSDAAAKRKGAVAMVPEGRYIIRQPSAAVEWPPWAPPATGAQAPQVGREGGGKK
jgi:hypothetical protein